jgi:hypothetical protein
MGGSNGMTDLIDRLYNTRLEGIEELCWEAADEIKRLREYIVQQHNYFTGNLVADVVVTTGTEYVDVQPNPFSRYAPRSGPR